MMGNVETGAGNDLVDTRLGTVQGTIDLGAGDDTAYGSAVADNNILGGTGNELVRGGTGFDILGYTDKAQKVQLSLNAVNVATVPLVSLPAVAR